MEKVVIIGAGLTGLSTSYHLEQHGFYDYEIYDKEDRPGGLCRSIKNDGFTFDYTGHLLHGKDEYFLSLLTKLCGLNNFNRIQRNAYVYSENVYTPYPYQMNLYGLPSAVIADCIEGYVNRPQVKENPRTFAQWVHVHFGQGFYKHFFLPYQSKLSSYDLTKISAEWAGGFVPDTSLRSIILGAVGKPADGDIGYNASFLYPTKGGIEFFVHSLVNAIKNPIHTQFHVKKIDLQKKVVYFGNGHETSFDILVNTMPLDVLIDSLQETSSTEFFKARPHLKCTSVLNFNIGIARPNLSGKHWIYFPEKKFPFYRIGFPHNLSTAMVKQGCSSISVELSYLHKSKKNPHVLLEESKNKLKKLFPFESSELVTEKILNISHAYVIYDEWRSKHLNSLLQAFAHNSIYSIGRYGAWKYSSMHHAILDGKELAEKLTILPATLHDAALHTFSRPINMGPKSKRTQKQ